MFGGKFGGPLPSHGSGSPNTNKRAITENTIEAKIIIF